MATDITPILDRIAEIAIGEGAQLERPPFYKRATDEILVYIVGRVTPVCAVIDFGRIVHDEQPERWERIVAARIRKAMQRA